MYSTLSDTADLPVQKSCKWARQTVLTYSLHLLKLSSVNAKKTTATASESFETAVNAVMLKHQRTD